MLVISFTIAAIIFIITGGAVVFLCMWGHFKEAIQTLIIGFVLAFSVSAGLIFLQGDTKMKDNNFIEVNFTEKEVNEILIEYYGWKIEDPTNKEELEKAKEEFKRIIIEKLY